MLDHMGMPISRLAQTKQFFVAALAPLGYAAYVLDPNGNNIELVCRKG